MEVNLQKYTFPGMHPAKKGAIVILPVLIIAAIFFFLTYKPKSQEIKQLAINITNQEKDIIVKKKKVLILPELKGELEELKKRFDTLKWQLPKEKEISNLLRQVSDLAKESELKINLWQPQQWIPDPDGILYEIPVNVKIDGFYHNLGEFFSKLTSLERIVNLKDIRLGNPVPKVSQSLLDISFSAVTYAVIPEEKRKQEIARE